MILRDWLFIWLNKYMKYVIKLKTFICYQNICNNHIIPVLGNKQMNELTVDIIQEFLYHKLENGNLKTGNSLSINSLLAIVSVLKQALKQAFILKIVEQDCTIGLKIPSSYEKQVEAFNRHEQSIIEHFCLHHPHKNYIGILICLYTGIRLGELLALTWTDIDFERGWLSINKTVSFICQNGKYTKYIDSPKTKQSNRTIPLSKELLLLLKEQKRTHNSIYVLSTKCGNIVSSRSYQRTFQVILERCQIPYKNFHALRHTFATRALELGMDVKTLSEILGHKDATITLNRYSHSLMDYKTSLLNKLGEHLGKI